MTLLVFALVVLIIAALVIVALRYIPGIPDPLNWIIPLLVLAIAAVVIAQRAGVF